MRARHLRLRRYLLMRASLAVTAALLLGSATVGCGDLGMAAYSGGPAVPHDVPPLGLLGAWQLVQSGGGAFGEMGESPVARILFRPVHVPSRTGEFSAYEQTVVPYRVEGDRLFAGSDTLAFAVRGDTLQVRNGHQDTVMHRDTPGDGLVGRWAPVGGQAKDVSTALESFEFRPGGLLCRVSLVPSKNRYFYTDGAQLTVVTVVDSARVPVWLHEYLFQVEGDTLSLLDTWVPDGDKPLLFGRLP